jgi:hypothetical protein
MHAKELAAYEKELDVMDQIISIKQFYENNPLSFILFKACPIYRMQYIGYRQENV